MRSPGENKMEVPFVKREVPKNQRTKRVLTVLSIDEKGVHRLMHEDAPADEPQFDIYLKNGQSLRCVESDLEELGLAPRRYSVDEDTGDIYDMDAAEAVRVSLDSIEVSKPKGS